MGEILEGLDDVPVSYQAREWFAKRGHVTIQRGLSDAGLNGLSHTARVETLRQITGDMVVAIVDMMTVQRESHVRLEPVEVPRDWWQALRERWLPAWWLRRHPVRCREIVTHHHYIRSCPHLVVEDKPHITWMTMEGERAWGDG